jgi:hypothetical protein
MPLTTAQETVHVAVTRAATSPTSLVRKMNGFAMLMTLVTVKYFEVRPP